MAGICVIELGERDVAVQVLPGDAAAQLAEQHDLYVRDPFLSFLALCRSASDRRVRPAVCEEVCECRADLFSFSHSYDNADHWDSTRNFLWHNK